MVKQGGWPRPQVRNDAEALATEVASVLGIGVFPDQLLELRLRGSLELFLQHLSVRLVVESVESVAVVEPAGQRPLSGICWAS